MILDTWKTGTSFKPLKFLHPIAQLNQRCGKIAHMKPKGFALHKKNKLQVNRVSVPGSHPDGAGCSVIGLKTLEIKKREEVVCVHFCMCVGECMCRGSIIGRKTAVKRKGRETNVRAIVHEIKIYL